MTSNTTPSGEAFSSEYYEKMPPYKAFDKIGGDSTNITGCATIGNTNTYIGYKFTKKVCVKLITLINCCYLSSSASMNTQGVKNFIIQASDDGNSWDNIYSGTAAIIENSDNTIQRFIINSNNSYLYWRIYCVDNYGWDSNITIAELGFWGRDVT